MGTKMGRAASNGVHNLGVASAKVGKSIMGKFASVGAKLSTVKLGPVLVFGSMGLGTVVAGTTFVTRLSERGVCENYYDYQNSVQNYSKELNENGTRDVEIQYSPTNAAVKAYYSIMSGKTLWQLQDDGTLLNATDPEAKQDYFDREPYLYLTSNFLYALNETMYNGKTMVYPEQFMKPVAFKYENDTFELKELVSDGKVVVESHPIKLTTGEKKKNKTVNSIADYGLASVVTYKEDELKQTLEGTYIQQDVWDDETASVKQVAIEEDFAYILSTDKIDVFDKAVTMAGTVSFDYSKEKKLQTAVSEGQSDNIQDNVTKVLYEKKQIVLLRAINDKGNIVENVTEAWCQKNGYTPIYTATKTESNGTVTTVNDVTAKWAEENGYTIVIPPAQEIKLYKYRSQDSGTYSESCHPIDNPDMYDDVGSEYLEDYLAHFETYYPTFKSRFYGQLEEIGTVANVEAYTKTENSTNGTASQKANFIESIKQQALEYQKLTGISAAIIIAQACLESGNLSGGSALSNPPNNNYFGIKAFKDWKGKVYTGWTTEEVNGVKIKVKASFRAYDKPGDCFYDYCKLIWNQTYGTPGKYRYRGAVGKGWKEGIELIVKGGYCTDSAYVSKIEDIVKKYNLEELEKDPNYQWDGTPPDFASNPNGGSNGTGGGSGGDTDGTLYKYTGNLTKEETDIFNEFVFRFIDQTNYNDNMLLDFAPNGSYRKYQKKITSGDYSKMLFTVLTFTNHTLKTEESLDNIDFWYDGFIGQRRDTNETESYIGEGDWWWIVPDSFTITSKYGPRNSPTAGASSYHRGIDIGVAENSDIIATRAGKVIVAQYGSAEGNWVAIDHGDGFVSLYMHNSKLLVKVGDEVKQGQVIAKSGNTGVSTGPHCHFAIKKDGEYVNPEDYVHPEATPTKTSSSRSEDKKNGTQTASALRDDMVKWAKSKVGNHYVYGGTNPNCPYWGRNASAGKCTGGTDCSGFTQAIYKQFGMTIPRTAAAQCSAFSHIKKSELKKGDLLFYNDKSGNIGHVSMYIGNGKVVHASSSSTGIVISNISYRTPAYYGRYKGIDKVEKKYSKKAAKKSK